MLELSKIIQVRGLTPQQAILEVLTRGENYGLGLRDAIRERTKGRVDLGPGTLYPALHALERDGLVTSREAEPTAERGGRPKVFYKLTGLGAKAAVSIREQSCDFYGFGGLAGVRGG